MKTSRARPSDVVLTERDELLMEELARMRLLTRPQIERMGFFGSTSRANARLRKLRLAGFVRAVEAPLGSDPSLGIYAPGKSAAPVLCRRMGMDLQGAEGLSRSPSPLLTAHSIATADVRIAFAPLTVGGWRGEAECYHAYSLRESSSQDWRRESLRPDGACVLALGGSPTWAFFEVDLGHVSRDRFAEKLHRYAAYRSSRLFQKRYGEEGFAVLVVAPGERRLESLGRLARRVDGIGALLCTFADLRAQGAAAPVWRRPTGERTALAAAGGAP